MAHFEKPASAPSEHATYFLNKHSHVERLELLQNKSAGIILRYGGPGGEKLDVTLDNPELATLTEKAHPGQQGRLFTIAAKNVVSFGGAIIAAKTSDGRDYARGVQFEVITPMDVKAKKAVLHVLSLPSIQRIRFTIDDFRIEPRMFAQVKKAVHDGKIHVRAGQLGGFGMYTVSRNTFTLDTFASFTAIHEQALLVHEAVHAIRDAVYAREVNVFTDEATAILAQMTFWRAALPKNQKEPHLGHEDQRAHSIGWELAAKVLAGNQPQGAEIARLISAVRQNPLYSSFSNDPTRRYDGI